MGCGEASTTGVLHVADAVTAPGHAPCRVTMSITTYHPSSLVEQVPQLPPLAEALTEEQHQQQLGEQQKQVCGLQFSWH